MQQRSLFKLNITQIQSEQGDLMKPQEIFIDSVQVQQPFQIEIKKNEIDQQQQMTINPFFKNPLDEDFNNLSLLTNTEPNNQSSLQQTQQQNSKSQKKSSIISQNDISKEENNENQEILKIDDYTWPQSKNEELQNVKKLSITSLQYNGYTYNYKTTNKQKKYYYCQFYKVKGINCNSAIVLNNNKYYMVIDNIQGTLKLHNSYCVDKMNKLQMNFINNKLQSDCQLTLDIKKERLADFIAQKMTDNPGYKTRELYDELTKYSKEGKKDLDGFGYKQVKVYYREFVKDNETDQNYVFKVYQKFQNKQWLRHVSSTNLIGQQFSIHIWFTPRQCETLFQNKNLKIDPTYYSTPLFKPVYECDYEKKSRSYQALSMKTFDDIFQLNLEVGIILMDSKNYEAYFQALNTFKSIIESQKNKPLIIDHLSTDKELALVKASYAVFSGDYKGDYKNPNLELKNSEFKQFLDPFHVSQDWLKYMRVNGFISKFGQVKTIQIMKVYQQVLYVDKDQQEDEFNNAYQFLQDENSKDEEKLQKINQFQQYFDKNWLPFVKLGFLNYQNVKKAKNSTGQLEESHKKINKTIGYKPCYFDYMKYKEKILIKQNNKLDYLTNNPELVQEYIERKKIFVPKYMIYKNKQKNKKQNKSNTDNDTDTEYSSTESSSSNETDYSDNDEYWQSLLDIDLQYLNTENSGKPLLRGALKKKAECNKSIFSESEQKKIFPVRQNTDQKWLSQGTNDCWVTNFLTFTFVLIVQKDNQILSIIQNELFQYPQFCQAYQKLINKEYNNNICKELTEQNLYTKYDFIEYGSSGTPNSLFKFFKDINLTSCSITYKGSCPKCLKQKQNEENYDLSIPLFLTKETFTKILDQNKSCVFQDVLQETINLNRTKTIKCKNTAHLTNLDSRHFINNCPLVKSRTSSLPIYFIVGIEDDVLYHIFEENETYKEIYKSQKLVPRNIQLTDFQNNTVSFDLQGIIYMSNGNHFVCDLNNPYFNDKSQSDGWYSYDPFWKMHNQEPFININDYRQQSYKNLLPTTILFKQN